MVWGVFFAGGKSNLVFLEGNQDSVAYTTTLKKHLLPVMRRNFHRNAVFQQDNASIHTAKVTQDFFISEKVKVMDWPAKSLDLNTIEN
ncbi:hypothetical protein ACHHYP_20530, partial [Achlya hypogyna]